VAIEAGQRQRAVKPLANFLHQGKRTLHTRMAASTGCHGDQAIGTFFNGLARKLVVDDVVQHHTAPAMHGLVHILTRAQAGDDDGHLVLGADLHVVLETVIALVHDLIDGEWCRRAIGMGLVPGRQSLGDLCQPVLQLLGRAGIERRHGADDTGLALLDDKLGIADDEKRRADDRQSQLFEGRWQLGHMLSPSSFYK
jgi:hypothetical protein